MNNIKRIAKKFSSGSVVFVCLAVIYLLATVLFFNDTLKYHTNLYAGNAAYMQGSFGDAEVNYSKASLGKQTELELTYNLANSYYQQGRYKEAIVAYKRVAMPGKSDNLQAATLSNLGNAYFMAGDTLNSLKALQTALLLDRKNTKVRQNYLFVLDKVQANKKEKDEEIKKDQKEKSTDKPESKSSPESDEKGKPTNDQSDQEYEVSEQEMENLFDMINQSEKSAQKRINKSKQKHKPLPTDGYAY